MMRGGRDARPRTITRSCETGTTLGSAAGAGLEVLLARGTTVDARGQMAVLPHLLWLGSSPDVVVGGQCADVERAAVPAACGARDVGERVLKRVAVLSVKLDVERHEAERLERRN